MFYVSENFAKVQATLPKTDNMSKVVETTKQLAALWKELPANIKEIYIEKATDDKKRREDEMEKYKANLPPPKPLTAFFLYSASVREQVKSENPNSSLGDRAKIIGQMWKEVSQTEKNKFNKEAHDKYNDYIKRKSAWNKEHGKAEEEEKDELD